MQRDPYQIKSRGTSWGSVLMALYRAQKFVNVDDLVQLSGQDLAAVQRALDFLLKQGWADQLADGPQWVCTPAARAVMQSLERSKVLQPWL